MFSTEQIYMDIVYIILDEIINNREIELVFLDTYKEIMPDVYKKAEEAVKMAKRGEVFMPILNENGSKNERQWYYKYLLYEFDAWDLLTEESATYMATVDAESYKKLYVYSETEVSQISDSEYVFYGTDEEVLKSPMFSKMIRKRREEISNHLGIDVQDLNSYIHNNMQVNVDYGTKETIDETGEKSGALIYLSDGFPGIVNRVCMSVIAKHGGGNDWLTYMTNGINNIYSDKKYKPDIDMLFTEYYRALVIDKYIKCEKEGESFTKIYLSRECKSKHIEEDINGIFAAYEIDVLTQMMMYIYEDYYRNFSWEQISENKTADRYNIIINQLKAIIEKKDKQIHRLGEANSVLKIQNTNNSADAVFAISKKNDELSKIIEEKDNEISELKQRIVLYEEFIRELEVEDNESNEENINIELLQSKRYLFVGNIESDFDELKKTFPSSIYMTNNTMSLSGISVDAIVLIIKRMSHSMFYKIKSSSLYQELPCVKSNAVKFEGIVNDMWKQTII